MAGGTTIIAGIAIPSTSPVFLAIVGFHVLLGLACVIAGAAAMLSRKGRGRHSTFGTIYFWCLAALAASATVLSVMRWRQDWHLFALGALAFGAVFLGRTALRRRWPGWPSLHLVGMGSSYILMVTAFYVDNGPSLPLWKELPAVAFWLLPAAVGIPLMVRALLYHPLVVRTRSHPAGSG